KQGSTHKIFRSLGILRNAILPPHHYTIRNHRMPRMKALNSVEREVFELPPIFNSVERERNFDFPMAIEQIAAGLRTPINQLCFLVSCGYFKTTHRFYPVHTFRPRDIGYVAKLASITIEEANLALATDMGLHR